jgi:hypothetical protein
LNALDNVAALVAHQNHRHFNPGFFQSFEGVDQERPTAEQ